MAEWVFGIMIGFYLGMAYRKLFVPITDDGSTEAQLEEQAYRAGYEAGHADGEQEAYWRATR